MINLENELAKVAEWEKVADKKPGDIGNKLKIHAQTYKELLLIQEYQQQEKGRYNLGLTIIREEIARQIVELLDETIQARRNARI